MAFGKDLNAVAADLARERGQRSANYFNAVNANQRQQQIDFDRERTATNVDLANRDYFTGAGQEGYQRQQDAINKAFVEKQYADTLRQQALQNRLSGEQLAQESTYRQDYLKALGDQTAARNAANPFTVEAINDELARIDPMLNEARKSHASIKQGFDQYLVASRDPNFVDPSKKGDELRKMLENSGKTLASLEDRRATLIYNRTSMGAKPPGSQELPPPQLPPAPPQVAAPTAPRSGVMAALGNLMRSPYTDAVRAAVPAVGAPLGAAKMAADYFQSTPAAAITQVQAQTIVVRKVNPETGEIVRLPIPPDKLPRAIEMGWERE